MPGPIVSMRGKPDINKPVKQKKTWPLIRPLRVQRHRGAIAIGSRPWHRSSHQYRATQFLGTGSDIDSMEAINNIAALQCIHHYVEGIRGGVNRRRAGNSYFGINVLGTAHVAGRKRSRTIDEKAYFPELRTGVGVEGIQTVMLGRNIQNVVSPVSRNRDAGIVQRLCVYIAVDSQRK